MNVTCCLVVTVPDLTDLINRRHISSFFLFSDDGVLDAVLLLRWQRALLDNEYTTCCWIHALLLFLSELIDDVGRGQARRADVDVTTLLLTNL